MQSEEAVAQKPFFATRHILFCLSSGFKINRMVSRPLLLGCGFAGKPVCGLPLWEGETDPPALHLLSAGISCLPEEQSWSVQNARLEVFIVEQENSISSWVKDGEAWEECNCRKMAFRHGACTGVLQAFFPDLKEVLSTMGCVSCH